MRSAFFDLPVRIGSQETRLRSPSNRTHRKTPRSDQLSGPEVTHRIPMNTNTLPWSAERKIAVSAVRFGGGSCFDFKKPSRFFDLPSSRSESRQNQVRHTVGRNRRSIGPPENGLRFVSFLPHKQSVTDPHNPLVPDSSPIGPTILHINHGLMALGPRDSDPLVDGLFGALIGSFCDE